MPEQPRENPGLQSQSQSDDAAAELHHRLTAARHRMIEKDLRGRGIADRRVLEAMHQVPRHRFVGERLMERAYEDHPLDIGHGQTISQPYIVARMTELLDVPPGGRVLEIGAGCGYQTAILIEMGAFVYAVEVIPDLAFALSHRLHSLNHRNFVCEARDGRMGWPEHAPFDRILLAACAEELPPALAGQLKPGGRIVAPVGRADGEQTLCRWTLTPQGLTAEDVCPVKFVPLV